MTTPAGEISRYFLTEEKNGASGLLLYWDVIINSAKKYGLEVHHAVLLVSFTFIFEDQKRLQSQLDLIGVINKVQMSILESK